MALSVGPNARRRAVRSSAIETVTGPAPRIAPKHADSREELAIAGAQLADETRQTALAAARQVLASMTADPEVMLALAINGLAVDIQMILDSDNEIAADPDVERRTRRAAVRGSRVLSGDPLADILLVGADRRRKPLALFSAADWTYLRTDAWSRVTTFTAHSAAADLALALLETEGKDVTGDLSTKARAKLRAAVSEAWR